jgi:hypothetical protein
LSPLTIASQSYASVVMAALQSGGPSCSGPAGVSTPAHGLHPSSPSWTRQTSASARMGGRGLGDHPPLVEHHALRARDRGCVAAGNTAGRTRGHGLEGGRPEPTHGRRRENQARVPFGHLRLVGISSTRRRPRQPSPHRMDQTEFPASKPPSRTQQKTESELSSPPTRHRKRSGRHRKMRG